MNGEVFCGAAWEALVRAECEALCLMCAERDPALRVEQEEILRYAGGAPQGELF